MITAQSITGIFVSTTSSLVSAILALMFSYSIYIVFWCYMADDKIPYSTTLKVYGYTYNDMQNVTEGCSKFYNMLTA